MPKVKTISKLLNRNSIKFNVQIILKLMLSLLDSTRKLTGI